MGSILIVAGFERYIPRLGPAPLILGLCLIPAILLLSLYYVGQSNANQQPRGCRRLGLQAQSNLADEHDSRYSGTGSSNGRGEATCKVKSLWIYPVKSCRGIELNRGQVISTGMQFDRIFSFAQLRSPFPVSLDTSTSEKSKHRWKFMAQRDFPMLAQVKTEIWLPDPSSSTYSPQQPNVQSGGVLVIKYPYEDGGLRGVVARLRAALGGEVPHKSVLLPLNPTAEQTDANGYKSEEMEIWKDSPLALNMANTIGPSSKIFMEELQAHLGCSNPLALFRTIPEHHRELYRCAPKREELGWQPKVGFGDAYPLHILNLASVQDVGSRLGKDAPSLSALNFRPNIIITGLKPYAEDEWKRIRIGKHEYYVSCRTVRCLLPNVDQNTGVADKIEPNKTLRSFRCVDEGATGKACLGMQMVPATEEAEIQVGDAIGVVETGEHYYIKQ